MDALRDYLIWLRDKGDKSEGYAAKRTAIARANLGDSSIHKARDYNASLVGDGTAIARRGVNQWERRKLNSWRAGGRITPDGVLRTSPRPAKPWTLEQVVAAAPEANFWDHLAALIILDGVVRSRFMDSLKNIREVVEGISDERVKRALLDPENQEPIRALIRDEVGALFGQILGTMQRVGAGAPPQTIRTRTERTCSKCQGKGHDVRSCTNTDQATPDKWPCIQCSDAQGVSLENPVTHPVPSARFHANDKPA